MKKLRIYGLCCLAGLLAACAVHTIDIQQGNIITPEMVAQLKPGMTRKQVRFIMGTPAITDVFHRNRWDYIYTLKRGRDLQERHHLALFFDGESLVRIEGSPDLVPPAAAKDGGG